MKNLKSIILYFILGWIIMEATYSTGILRLVISEKFSPSIIEPGGEGQILTQNNDFLSWEDNPIIDSSRVLNIPNDFLSLDAVMEYLSDKKIKSSAIVTIQFTNGVYPISNYIDLYHPDGRQIEIIGDEVNPSNVTLDFLNGGFRLNGQSLRKIAGITINNSGTTFNGISIHDNSFVRLNNLIIQNFKRGILVGRSSFLIADSITINNSSITGIRVVDKGFARISNSNINNSTDYAINVMRFGYVESINNSLNTFGIFGISIGNQSLVESSGTTATGTLSSIPANTIVSGNRYFRTF